MTSGISRLSISTTCLGMWLLLCCTQTFAQSPVVAVQKQSKNLTKRMAVESKKWNMLSIGGLPLVGESEKFVSGLMEKVFVPATSVKLIDAPKASSDLINRPADKFAERVLLTYIPRLTDPQAFTKSDNDDLLLYRGLLGESLMAPYLSAGKGGWLGNDEFERQDSFSRFHQEQGQRLKSAFLSPPYRVRTVRIIRVNEYDFAKKEFPLESGDYERPFQFDLELRHGYVSSYIARRFPVKLPAAWPLPPSEARQIPGELLKQRFGGNTDSYAVQSSVFDVFDPADSTSEGIPRITPVKERSDLNGHFTVKHVETALYADINLKKRLWTMLQNKPKSDNSKPVSGSPVKPVPEKSAADR